MLVPSSYRAIKGHISPTTRTPRCGGDDRILGTLGKFYLMWFWDCAKVLLKEPKSGGAWEWHQDFGYYYNEGLL